MSEKACRAWFVTGTDTGVGKTFASCALIHAARAQGFTALGMKPVASGAEIIDGKPINEDAARLLAAGSFDPGLERINPYCLQMSASPHLAAQEENIRIDTALIRQSFDELAGRCDRLFIEGAGGFLSPLSEEVDASRIAHELACPLILVVGMRLGCINHAQLTAKAIQSSNLRLDGWIANCLYPDTPHLSDTIKFLCHCLDAPLLGVLPYAPDAMPDTLARLITLPCQPISDTARSSFMQTESVAEPKIAGTDQENPSKDSSTSSAVNQEIPGKENFEEADAASEKTPDEAPPEANAASEESPGEELPKEPDAASEETSEETPPEANAASEESPGEELPEEPDAASEETSDETPPEANAISEESPGEELPELSSSEAAETSSMESGSTEPTFPAKKDERPFIILLFATVFAIIAFVTHAIRSDAPASKTRQPAEIGHIEAAPPEPEPAADSSPMAGQIAPDQLKRLETEALSDYKTAKEHYERGDYAISLTWHQKSRSGFEQLQTYYQEQVPDSAQSIAARKNLAAIYSALGEVYRSQKKYPDALDMFQKALSIYEKTPSNRNLDAATTNNNIAEIHRVRGDYALALPKYLEAYRILRIQVGEAHPMARAVRLNLARAHDKLEIAKPFGQWLEEALR